MLSFQTKEDKDTSHPQFSTFVKSMTSQQGKIFPNISGVFPSTKQ